MRRHPTVSGLAAGFRSSNVPWSATQEMKQRRVIYVVFALFWLFLSATVVLVSFKEFGSAVVSVLLMAFFFTQLEGQRSRLNAMIVNKPRATEHLTRWIQHKWLGWEPHRRRVVCSCLETLDMSTATYFPDSRRFAKVCKCGVGHFEIPPANEVAQHVPAADPEAA